jgi:hypothetical protein
MKDTKLTNRLQLGIVVLMAQGLVGCGPEASVQVPSSPASPSSFVPYVTIQPTPVGFVPNVTLSGVVFERAQGVEVPIERAWVYCEPCGEETHSGVYTDKQGFYSFKGVWGTAFSIRVTKDDYQDPPGPTNTGFPSGPGWRDVTINGDTRLNVQLARK